MSGSSTDAPPVPPLPVIRRDGTVLGFDVGSRRIGVASGSSLAYQARPLAVIDVHAAGPDWAAIDRLIREWRPDGFVVGDPLTLDGGTQPARERAHAFAGELRARYPLLPAVLVDERSSSMEAAQRFARERADGRKRRRDAAALDAMAAAVIVERWMGAPGDAIDIRQVSAATDSVADCSAAPAPAPGTAR